MLQRRDMLKLPLAAAGFSVVGLLAPRPVEFAAPQGRGSIDGFVVDNRFPESRLAGADLRWAGVRRHEVDGDVTSLWYDHLDAAWRNPGGGLAGLTGADVLFVLERLAWDRGRKLVFRELQSPSLAGRVEHRLSGSAIGMTMSRTTPLVSWIIAPAGRRTMRASWRAGMERGQS